MGPQHKGYHGPTTQWGYHKGKQGSVTVGPICTYLHLEELVAPRSEVVLVHIYPPVNALGPLEKLSAETQKPIAVLRAYHDKPKTSDGKKRSISFASSPTVQIISKYDESDRRDLFYSENEIECFRDEADLEDSGTF